MLLKSEIFDRIRDPVHELGVATYEYKGGEHNRRRQRAEESQEGSKPNPSSNEDACVLENSRLTRGTEGAVYIDIGHIGDFGLLFINFTGFLFLFQNKELLLASADFLAEVVIANGLGFLGLEMRNQVLCEISSIFDDKVDGGIEHPRGD